MKKCILFKPVKQFCYFQFTNFIMVALITPEQKRSINALITKTLQPHGLEGIFYSIEIFYRIRDAITEHRYSNEERAPSEELIEHTLLKMA